MLERRVATTKQKIREVFGAFPRGRVALETGAHSPWVSRLVADCGHEVIVAHARNVRLIGESTRKDDRPLDARTLARLARIDPQLLSPLPRRTRYVRPACPDPIAYIKECVSRKISWPFESSSNSLCDMSLLFLDTVNHRSPLTRIGSIDVKPPPTCELLRRGGLRIAMSSE